MKQKAFVFLILIFAIAPFRLPGAAHAAAQSCALELILAVDVSGSVDHRNYDLQMKGYAKAFRDRQIKHAIGALGPGGVVVTLVQWSSITEQTQAVGWSHVTDESSADAFAEAIDGTTRKFNRTGTAIGAALSYASGLFDTNQFRCARKVIDVSGDGKSNYGPEPALVRDLVVAIGITVNGLPITNTDTTLDKYYAEQVTGGPGAFVMTAIDYEDIATTIRGKLLRELTLNLSRGRSAPERQILTASEQRPNHPSNSESRDLRQR